MLNFTDYSNSDIYKKLLPEVENVAYIYMELPLESLNEDDFKKITQRICEDRLEDSLYFWVGLSEVEDLKDGDDWSDVNGCIENMIEQYRNELKE
ncbi:hypothetical protein bcgnr5378_29470 [Bacillus cereus]|uniref:Uncharacterized protein n=1 Tax=Bacillus cereus TaxID=1396 RepID=A0A164QTJ9_BACCE|nr:hypothetical protein [Bacillus cereus]KZD72166.1 hypothetical protein B4088_0627 [Bacillus cereus]